MADCQTKWRNIRNGFVRSLKPTPSGSSTKQKKLYYLHEELQFLLPFVKSIVHTNEPGNIPIPPKENTDESSSTTDEVPCTQKPTDTLETPSSRSDESNSFKKPKIRKVTNEADKAFVDWIKKKETKTDSARKMFLLSLLPDVENLSEEQMRKFRIKVLLLLEEIQSNQSHPPQVTQQYENTYYPIHQSQEYRDNNHSPISSVDSNTNSSFPPISPINYSVNTNVSEDLSQLENFENL